MQNDSQTHTYSVAVAGATGYAGGEVLRAVAMHPHLDVTCVTGQSSVEKTMAEFVPNIPQYSALCVEETTPEVLSGHDVVILALPHGASGKLASELHDVKVVVDLGADHRLEKKSDWDAYYGGDFSDHWVYGMPELICGRLDAGGTDGYIKQRSHLVGATHIAGPGCNVTAVTLGFQPAVAHELVEPQITANLVVGYSGAGRKLGQVNLLASEALGSARPYSVGGKHRHIPEIIQNLSHAAQYGKNGGEEFSLGFTPVLAPMSRGILATVSAPLSEKARGMSIEDIYELYMSVYGEEKFIHILPQGVLLSTGDVIGSNAAHISLAVDKNAGLLYAFGAIDNLNRGTAGQAIQSLNVALGLPEDEGLTTIGVAP